MRNPARTETSVLRFFSGSCAFRTIVTRTGPKSCGQKGPFGSACDSANRPFRREYFHIG